MRFSAFNSFLACFRKKARMAGAVSMRLFAFNLFLAFFLAPMAVIFGFTSTRRQASAQIIESTAQVITVAIHLTAADGIITIGELIEREGNPGFPPLPIASLRFLVSPGGSPLELPGIPGYHPPNWRLTIPVGGDVKFRTTYVPLPAQDAFNIYPARTQGTCDAFISVEFYDSLDQPPTGFVIGTEALHITTADGIKSLAQLITEQSLGTPLGNFPMSSIQIIVDSAGSALNFTHTPQGVQFTLNPGESIKWDVPLTSKPVMETLESYCVQSPGVTNVLIVVKLITGL